MALSGLFGAERPVRGGSVEGSKFFAHGFVFAEVPAEVQVPEIGSGHGEGFQGVPHGGFDFGGGEKGFEFHHTGEVGVGEQAVVELEAAHLFRAPGGEVFEGRIGAFDPAEHFLESLPLRFQNRDDLGQEFAQFALGVATLGPFGQFHHGQREGGMVDEVGFEVVGHEQVFRVGSAW
jgi:hypothetical protein